MKILAISDVHNRFDQFPISELPDADICVVAGDITNQGMRDFKFMRAACDWMGELADKYRVFFIPGNHDWGVNNETFAFNPRRRNSVYGIDRVWLGIGGTDFSIVGINLSPCFDLPFLEREWTGMTADERRDFLTFDALPCADIMVSHCPPQNVLDVALSFPGSDRRRNIGSPGLCGYMDKCRPRLVICGHAHGNIGTEDLVWASGEETAVVNTAEAATLIEMTGKTVSCEVVRRAV